MTRREALTSEPGAARAVGIAGDRDALLVVMDVVAGAPAIVGDLQEQGGDLVDQIVVVFAGTVRFDERIDTDEADVEPLDDVAQGVAELAWLGLAVAIDLGQPQVVRGPVVQPAVEVALHELVMQAGGADAAAQLGLVVFETDDQHSGPLEHMLAGEIAAAEGERDELQQPDRGLAGAPGAGQPRQEPATEIGAEEPLPRRDRPVIDSGGLHVRLTRRHQCVGTFVVGLGVLDDGFEVGLLFVTTYVARNLYPRAAPPDSWRSLRSARVPPMGTTWTSRPD